MLRSNGERNSVVILLAKLAEGTGDKDTDVQLECPLPQNTKLTRVPLNRFLSAPTDVLDLCWLNSNGACAWDHSANYEKLHLLKSQQARLASLKKLFSTQSSLRRSAASSPFPLARMPKSGEKVDFKLQRVGRMNAPYAQGILSKFAGVFARPSYDHNYYDVREVQVEPAEHVAAVTKKAGGMEKAKAAVKPVAKPLVKKATAKK